MELYIDPYNHRIRIDDYRGNVQHVIENAEDIAIELKVEKVIIIAKMEHFALLLESAYQCEAMVDHFFRGSDAYFFTKYFSENRKQSDQWMNEDKMFQSVKSMEKTINKVDLQIPLLYELKKIATSDAERLAKLYQEVFQLYPTPMHDPSYIRKTMGMGTIYYGVIYKGQESQIVSAASAEVDSRNYNAELTDCATLAHHRKFGLMKFILEKLEEDLKKKGIFCSYSIARAQSFGMNAVLHQLGYSYRGRLINNCYIYDKLENMNMWVKDLSQN